VAGVAGYKNLQIFFAVHITKEKNSASCIRMDISLRMAAPRYSNDPLAMGHWTRSKIWRWTRRFEESLVVRVSLTKVVAMRADLY
jgi:hypothetical protein